MLVLFAVSACGPERQYPTRDGSVLFARAVDAGFGSTAAAIVVDRCPEAALAASPVESRVGEAVNLAAHATDPDSGDTLTFSWSARAGSFDRPTAPSTAYTCPGRDQAGPQSIELTVSDGACQITRTATVFCLALADGGGPPVSSRDAGGTCATNDPTTCEGDTCNQCTTDNCDTLAGVNLRGGTPLAGCDIYVSDLQRQQCQRAYACMHDRGCVQNSNPIRCWCGDVDPALCETGAAPGNGPCRQELFEAAGTSDPVLVDLRLTDPQFAVGGAINLATCRSVYCSALSDPPSTACRL